jgi:D-alanine-D-alanine ligase
MACSVHSVAVLMGGPSSEREVSLRSGRAVAAGLREAGYTVQAVELTGREAPVPAGVEAVFLALHGAFGEDGGIQAMLDARRMPYTGSGAEASRRAMDKVVSKRLFDGHHIPTPAYEVLLPGQARSLPLPVFVKPPREGSSIGAHKVACEREWAAAVADARRFGDDVLVEAFVPGRELTVGIVDGQVLPAVEIVAPDGNYDYNAKYGGGSHYRVPAPLDPPLAARCGQLAADAFRVLGCRGMGRVDFRVAPDGAPFVLEMNTIPGFTPTSLLPKAAAAAGLTFAALCARIMRTAAYGP